MELVELIVQGLKGASEQGRVPFQPALTVLSAGSREKLYARVILDLLYPKGTEPSLLDLDMPGAQSRVALTVQGRDGNRYRLLHDAHTGRRALQKMVGDKAEVLTNSSGEIAQAVTATLGFPTEDVLKELLFCLREDLPSQRPVSAKAAKKSSSSSSSGSKAEKPLPPGFDGPSSSPRREDKPLPPGFSDEGDPVVDRGERTDAEIQARIRELDEILAAQAHVKDLEFELDGLQKRGFEIEAKLRPLTTLKRSVQQAEEQLKQTEHLANVPPDLAAQGDRLHQARADTERVVNEIEDEKERMLASSRTLDRTGRQNPLDVAQRDPLVKYGVAAGAGAIALGLIGAVAEPALQWAALLDIPAFAVALFGGIRVLGTLEQGESIRRRVVRLDEKRKKVEEKLKIDEQHVKSLLDRFGFTLDQLPDVQQQLAQRVEVQGVLERARAALAEAQREGDARSLEAEQAEVQARAKAIEEKLSNASAGFTSVGDLMAEKEELEAMLRGGGGGASKKAAPVVEKAPEPTPVEDSGPVMAAADDLGLRLLELARDVLMAATVEDVAKLCAGRASQILQALADGRFREVRFSGRGDTSVVDAAAGQPIPFGMLPPFDRDITYLAIKVALVEVVTKRGRLPVLFDRGLDTLADTKGPILQKMLQFLASTAQVVSISEKPALGGRPS